MIKSCAVGKGIAFVNLWPKARYILTANANAKRILTSHGCFGANGSQELNTAQLFELFVLWCQNLYGIPRKYKSYLALYDNMYLFCFTLQFSLFIFEWRLILLNVLFLSSFLSIFDIDYAALRTMHRNMQANNKSWTKLMTSGRIVYFIEI